MKFAHVGNGLCSIGECACPRIYQPIEYDDMPGDMVTKEEYDRVCSELTAARERMAEFYALAERARKLLVEAGYPVELLEPEKAAK